MSKPKDQQNHHKNREARVFAFQFLYHFQWDDFFADAKMLQESLESKDNSDVDKEIAQFRESVPAPFNQDIYDFSLSLIKGVLLKAPTIENDLEQYSKNWKLSRMSKVDLTLLKLGIYELEYIKLTPKKVVINEILEIAKEFSADKSTNFINGILDQVAAKVK
jgi:N utilization substance protein B